MKYLKISSLLVLSLLLFAPAALADVECEVLQPFPVIRAESHDGEKVDDVGIRCVRVGMRMISMTAATPLGRGSNNAEFDIRSRPAVLGSPWPTTTTRIP